MSMALQEARERRPIAADSLSGLRAADAEQDWSTLSIVRRDRARTHILRTGEGEVRGELDRAIFVNSDSVLVGLAILSVVVPSSKTTF